MRSEQKRKEGSERTSMMRKITGMIESDMKTREDAGKTPRPLANTATRMMSVGGLNLLSDECMGIPFQVNNPCRMPPLAAGEHE